MVQGNQTPQNRDYQPRQERDREQNRYIELHDVHDNSAVSGHCRCATAMWAGVSSRNSVQTSRSRSCPGGKRQQIELAAPYRKRPSDIDCFRRENNSIGESMSAVVVARKWLETMASVERCEASKCATPSD